jgi:F-type H+-transporting ATPase subunit delta
MNDGRVQSYATAFYEAAFEHWLNALDAAAVALARNPGLLDRLQDEQADFATRQRQLDGIVLPETDASVRNLLYTLLQRGDLSLLPQVSEALRQRVHEAETGPVPVEVVTAVPLADDQRQTLETRLRAQYGTALIYEYRIDPAILGGMIVRVGDQLIDGSVATRLAAMKQTLGVRTAE